MCEDVCRLAASDVSGSCLFVFLCRPVAKYAYAGFINDSYVSVKQLKSWAGDLEPCARGAAILSSHRLKPCGCSSQRDIFWKCESSFDVRATSVSCLHKHSVVRLLGHIALLGHSLADSAAVRALRALNTEVWQSYKSRGPPCCRQNLLQSLSSPKSSL